MAEAAAPTAEVRGAFDAFPEEARATLLELRALILRVAAETPAIGPLTETLKWGQPAYRPRRPRVGTTVRLGVAGGGAAAIFVHCRTTLVTDFRQTVPDALAFEGNRAVLLPAYGSPPEAPLRLFLHAALTYHLRRAT